MKHLITIFLIGLSLTGIAQDTLTIYFDDNWKETKKGNASYYRKAFKNGNKTWTTNDFFLEGKLQMSGAYKSKKLKKKHGHFIFYFENGQKKTDKTYVKDKPSGEFTSWFEDGTIKIKGQYDNKGKKTGDWKSWYSNENVDFEGEYVKDERVNEWKWYFENGQISALEIYEQGDPIKLKYWNEDGSLVEGDLNVQMMPEFKGGQAGMQNYLGQNLKYPENAKSSWVSGVVIVNFVVGKDGEVIGSKVVKSIHPLLDKEALRVVNNMPNWSPGKQHNRPVSVSYNLPLKFILK